MTKRLFLRFLSVALSAALLTAALSTGLTSFAALEKRQSSAESTKSEEAWAAYRSHAKYFQKNKRLGWYSEKRLQDEIQTARTNYEALRQVSRSNPSAYKGLAEEYALDFDAAEEQRIVIAQALTESDAHDLVAVIAKAIQGEAPYPAMAYNSTYQTYTFDAAGLSFEQLLALYERTVLADAALTGSVAGEPNFPGYDVAARLASAHGITGANAPARAIAAIHASVQGFDPRMLADYSAVPAGSGWTSDPNYEAAPAELAALHAAGGPLLSDPEKPTYERMPSAAHPAPVTVLVDDGTNPPYYVTVDAPDFAAFPRSSPAPNPAVDPIAHGAWQFTQAIYDWIDRYEQLDYPAAPNTATPPADNSTRENAAYPIAGTDAQKHGYIINLQQRHQLNTTYLIALDNALRQPENAYKWLQTVWNIYQNDPSEANRQEFYSAVSRYYSMLTIQPDGTYAASNGAFVPNGVNEGIAGYNNMLRQMEIVAIYGAFFNSYRLSLEPEDFVRYSNENLSSEYATVEQRMRQFMREYPGETMPSEWNGYLESLQKGIFLRVLDEIESFRGEAAAIVQEYDPHTLLSGTYAYNLNNLDLWPLIKGMFELTQVQQTQLALAQQVLALLRGYGMNYDTLHWDLMDGRVAPLYDDWLPARGLDNPMTLQVGNDEFYVEYEHVENMINKLDTLLTSAWFHLRWGSSPSAQQPITFQLPQLDSEFLSRLGQMRTSSGELVITDPHTGAIITLPPLETARNTERYVDEAAGVTAERRWIQAYRADVLLYLLHSAFNAVNAGETDGMQMLSWILHQVMPSESAVNETAEHLSTLVPQALQNAMEGIDLSAAVRPFMTNLLEKAVSENIISDALPNTVLGFYRMVTEAMSPILDGALLRRPGDTSGRGLIDDVRFAVISPRIELTLGYMLEQISGRYRYSITVNDLLELPEFQEMFDFGGASSWLELMLGAQITPQEMTANWPTNWPKADGVVPSGAPAYVQTIAENLSDIYRELEASGARFPSANFQFGLEKIVDYTQQRQAFEDVMAFAMSGLAFLFSALVSGNALKTEQVQGRQDDYWYNDLIVGLEGVTRKLNDLIEGALRIFNAPLELLGLPTINFPIIKLPDLRVSDYVGDSDYLENQGNLHWRGRFDSRVGVESTLSAANAYGRIFIPLFELLGIPQELILYSEAELNQRIAALTATQDSAARKETALTLTQSLFNPLLNWLAPVDEADTPLSLGYRPLGKLLDILPNLAFVTEQKIIPKLVSDVLDDLRLDVTLHLGGAGGDSLNGLVEILADYIQYELLDMNFFLDLFVYALPNLIGAGPLMTSILEAAGMGMAFIFAIPMVEIVQLPAGSYAGMFCNRNDGSGIAANEDLFVTILKDATSIEPGSGVRSATLATLAGFFGGDSAANAFSFKLFGEAGLPLGQLINDQQPVLGYLKDQTGIDFGGDLNALLGGILPASDDLEFVENEQVSQLIDGLAQSSGHAIAWLVELFNPQTYPVQDYMNYALLDQAKSRNRVLNEVQYSKIWPRKMADAYFDRLPEFLDNFSAFCYEQAFLDWLYDQLEAAWDIDMRNIYTTENLQRLLDFINEQAGEFLPWLGLSALTLDENVTVNDRESFIEALIEVLLPAAPVLKTLLVGGRESEVPWFGEQYANNGMALDLENTASPGIGRAGDNLTFINDYIGVSGYDGYKHGVIPILEAFGVPQRDILTHEDYAAQVTGSDGDAQLFRLIIEPLLGVVDRVVSDPIGELPQVLGNIAYFLTAEGGNQNMLLDDSAQNGFVEALNRIFRPVYAALDMVTPMAALGDVFGLLGLEYPFQLSVGGMHQDVFLAPDISLNSIITGLSRSWFAELSDELGLELTLALQDIMELLTGTLTVYRSVNGQNDAVRLEVDRADLFTQAARRLLPLIFSEENYAEMRLFIAARLSPVTRDAVLYLLDALMDMVRGMEGDKAADLVLAVMFHLFLAKNHMIETLFSLRECRGRLTAFFETLSINDALGPIAILAGTTLAAGTAVALAPLTLAGAAAAILGSLGLTGLAAWLIKDQPCCGKAKQPDLEPELHVPDCPNVPGEGYVKPPKTGENYAVAIGVSTIGGLALLGAVLIRKKRRRYA